MSSGKFFAGMPSINIPRSKWNTAYNVTGSYKHGYLNVIDAIPVLPGDSISVNIKDLTRMQTPIAPIFGNIKQHFVAMFVPNRLVWNHQEEHFGANKSSAGYQTANYKLPRCRFDEVVVGSLSHQLGKPLKAASDVDANNRSYYLAGILKERAYYLCWNEYFRAQQVTNPCILQFADSNDMPFINGVVQQTSMIGKFPDGTLIHPGKANSLLRVAKDFDCYTACTISPQYGAAVEIPLGTTAPLVMGNSYSIGGTISEFMFDNVKVSGTGGSITDGEIATEISSGVSATKTRLYADLSTAVAAKVNDLRYAFAVQKYLERANFAGNYYFGILQVHYGVTSPDSRLQRPEFLGHFEEDILVHQVVSTADTTNSNVKTSVGSTGAMSVTASGMVNLCNKAFVEPGILMIFRYCRHRQVYSQGIMKEDFKTDRFETYTPELCNLGDDSVHTKELFWKAGDDAIFGYQEHWYEYRYRPDRVTGMLDPNGANSLDFWTLANKFSSVPQLNDDFILEGRANLDRALTTGSSYDEYISDTFIQLTLTREMPVRTIPGLIDHFGAM